MIFNDVGKDALYNAMCECGAEYASKNGKDCRAEDIVLVMDFMEEAGRMEFIDMVVDQLKKNGYKISK